MQQQPQFVRFIVASGKYTCDRQMFLIDELRVLVRGPTL